MHPEVRQIGPGHCPKCGMALEPLMPTPIEDDSEIRSVRRRFWIALALALPVMVAAMVPHLVGRTLDPAVARILRLLELVLSAPVVLWVAISYYRRGWLGVVHRAPNMYTLIGLGVIVAFTYSLIATFFTGQFPAMMRDEHGMVGVYFEVAAMIVALVLLGEWLELTARGRTGDNRTTAQAVAERMSLSRAGAGVCLISPLVSPGGRKARTMRELHALIALRIGWVSVVYILSVRQACVPSSRRISRRSTRDTKATSIAAIGRALNTV
jgi:Cu+-exporting ATPase